MRDREAGLINPQAARAAASLTSTDGETGTFLGLSLPSKSSAPVR
jgi:hypothetical protein